MGNLALAYLVRAQNGVAPAKTFLASYRQCSGGVPHDLVVIYKGFRNRELLQEHEAILRDYPHQSLRVGDFGFDIGAYWAAVQRHDHHFFCFLNSFSVLLDPDWLGKLLQQASRPEVGLAGATGSYESFLTNAIDRLQQYPKPRLLAPLVRLWLRGRFAPFPNPHVRTNAFIAKRETLLQIRPGRMFTKMDACRFESGTQGLTQQVLKLGLKVLVVGKDGRGYEPEEWSISRTFRQGDQENLLVADNRTRDYQQADPAQRAYLSRLAWGDLA